MRKEHIYKGLERIIEAGFGPLDIGEDLQRTIQQSIKGYVKRYFRPRNPPLGMLIKRGKRLAWIAGSVYMALSGLVAGMSWGIPLVVIILIESVMIAAALSVFERKE